MKKKKNKAKISKSTILLFIILLVGLFLLLYPSVADYWNKFHQTRAIAAYDEEAAKLSQEEKDSEIQRAREYNAKLLNKVYPWSMSDSELEEYNSILNVSDTGVMGYITVPAARIQLPIYHGTEDAILQKAAGHIETTSFPVGGESTHAVISGHRGLPSARLFTDIDRLVEGDKFQITVLNEKFSYEVDQISIVLPEDMSQLGIEEGQDYVTLVTCTPYGVNSHRLLVRGHRISNLAYDMDGLESEANIVDAVLVAPLVAIPILLLLLIYLLIRTRKKKDKKDKDNNNNSNYEENYDETGDIVEPEISQNPREDEK